MADEIYVGINQYTGGIEQDLEELKKQVKFDIRCCLPAIIKDIDYDAMTVAVQPVIKENVILSGGKVESLQLPVIYDVPVLFLSSGFNDDKVSIKLPLTLDSECLLFFADICIDAWWQSGGIQSQFEDRRHDLSDCFCLPCQMSQVNKNKLSTVPIWESQKTPKETRTITNGLVLEKGESMIVLENNKINIISDEVLINGNSI